MNVLNELLLGTLFTMFGTNLFFQLLREYFLQDSKQIDELQELHYKCTLNNKYLSSNKLNKGYATD